MLTKLLCVVWEKHYWLLPFQDRVMEGGFFGVRSSVLFREDLQVLVVDGNADSRDLLMALLGQYGVETLTATCVEEAVGIMQQTNPDLVISELALPGEDGYSLIKQVQTFELARGVRIPAIALTVCARTCDRTGALAAGFCEYLSKPFDLDTLVQTAFQVLEYAEE